MNVLMVGTALDTNGQKHRYVEAARRWGEDPDVLKALWVGRNDLAGVAGRFSEASVKEPGPLIIRSAHRAQYAYFKFPGDIHWSRQTEYEVRKLAEEADVVHLTNDVKAYLHLRLPKMRKPAVLHHHGTLFRTQSPRLLHDAKRLHMVQAVSTIDLKLIAPKVLHWAPTAYDLEALAKIRKEHRRSPDGKVRIVSAPTNREIKSTNALERAVAELQKEGLPVELLLIEGKSWAECMALKATADIYFDQIILGYGCNAVEAWGMGIPVVAGADAPILNAMRKEWGSLPFYEASEETLVDDLRRIVTDPSIQREYVAKGTKHAEQYHAEKPALLKLAELYRMAIEMRAEYDDVVDEYALLPGKFTAQRRNLEVRLASKTVYFRDGVADITDPALAQRLRRLIAFNNPNSIVEVLDA